ncbi:hypothetical protein BOTU111921_29330 [Bordetella tumbae]
MAALDRLLAGPVDQVVFVKTTQASAARSLGISERVSITAASNAPRVVMQTPQEKLSSGLPDSSAESVDLLSA